MALSAKYTKGIEIEIGGNATKLKTALDRAARRQPVPAETRSAQGAWARTSARERRCV